MGSSKRRLGVVCGDGIEEGQMTITDGDVWNDFFDEIEDIPSSQLTFLSSQAQASDNDTCGADADADVNANTVISDIKTVFANASKTSVLSQPVTPKSKVSEAISPRPTVVAKLTRDYKEYRTHTSDNILSEAMPVPKKACLSGVDITDLRALAITHQHQESIEYVLDGLRVKSGPTLLDLNPILLSTLFDLAYSPQTNTSIRILERLARLILKKSFNDKYEGQFLKWLGCINIYLILNALSLDSEKAEARKVVMLHACLIIDALKNTNNQSLPIAVKQNKDTLDKKLGLAPHISFIKLLTGMGAINSWQSVECICGVFFRSTPPHKITCVEALETYISGDNPIEDAGLLDQVFDSIRFELGQVSDLDTRLMKAALLCLKSSLNIELKIFDLHLLNKATRILCESLEASQLLDIQMDFALYLCGILIELGDLKMSKLDLSMLASCLACTTITDLHLKGYVALLLSKSMLTISKKERARVRESLKEFLTATGSKGLRTDIQSSLDRLIREDSISLQKD